MPTHPVGLFGGCSGKHGKESTLQMQGCWSVPSTVLFFPRDLESHLTLGSWGLQREGQLSLEEDLEMMTGAYVGLPELQMEDTRKKCQVNGDQTGFIQSVPITLMFSIWLTELSQNLGEDQDGEEVG